MTCVTYSLPRGRFQLRECEERIDELCYGSTKVVFKTWKLVFKTKILDTKFKGSTKYVFSLDHEIQDHNKKLFPTSLMDAVITN